MIRLLRYCILLVLLSACAGHFHVSEVKSTHYELKTAKNDSVVNLSVLPYKEKLDKEMNHVIAYSDSALTRDGFESSLGNFVLMALDGYKSKNQKDISSSIVVFVNRGGLRNNLPSGYITKGNIFELMPFENEIVIISITAQKLKEAVNAMIKENKLISSHLTVDIKDKQVGSILVNGSPIDFNMSYNPYCAYNTTYVCPLPPPQNHLALPILAGEKVYGPDLAH